MASVLFLVACFHICILVMFLQVFDLLVWIHLVFLPCVLFYVDCKQDGLKLNPTHFQSLYVFFLLLTFILFAVAILMCVDIKTPSYGNCLNSTIGGIFSIVRFYWICSLFAPRALFIILMLQTVEGILFS